MYDFLTGKIMEFTDSITNSFNNFFNLNSESNNPQPQLDLLDVDVDPNANSFTSESDTSQSSLQTNLNLADSIINMARSFVGGKYLLGSQNPEKRTFDCSGLMNYVFKQHGIKIPRTTASLNRDGHRIDRSQVRPGDLALFIEKGKDHGHVGLVAAVNGNTFTMIDARGRKFGIVERSVKMSSPTAFLRYLPTGKNTKTSFELIQNAVSTPSSNVYFRSHSDYIKKMYGIFYKELQNQGIDAAKYAPVLVAQTAIESAWGNSGLSRNANNFSGIKGKKGGGYTAKTREHNGTNYYTKTATFRSYASIEDFAKDYISLLKNRFGAFNVEPGLFIAQIRSKKYFTAPLAKYQNTFNKVLQTVLKTL